MPDLRKFFQDPDWHFVEEMLSRETEDLKNVDTIDINLPAETIKAIVAGRQETLRLIDRFHRSVETSKQINNNTPTTFK